MKHLLYKICLLFLLTLDTFGQSTTPDTFSALQAELANQPDSVRIEKLRQFAQYNVERGNFAAATSANQEMMAIAKQTNNPLFLGKAYISAGYIARNENNPTQAILNFQQASTIYQARGDWPRLVSTLYRIGGIYVDVRNLSLAESYYTKAIALARQHHLIGELAYLYGDLATIYDIRKQPAKALSLNATAIRLSRSVKQDVSYGLFNQAIYLKNAGRYDQSLAAYREVLTIAEKQQDNVLKNMVYLNMPNTLLLMNRPDEAERYARLALQTAHQQPNAQELLLEIYAVLTAIHEKKGQYQQALAYHKQWVVHRDSLFNAEKNRQLVEAETRFQTREKQQQIQHLDEVNLRQKQQLLFLVGGVLILALLLGTMFWQYRALGRANERVSQTLSELKRTQNQLIHKEKMASLGELTAGIAHEIQNPLNFVNNFSEVSAELVAEQKEALAKGDLEEAGFIAEDLSSNLDKINHHGGRAAAIVRGMLEHSRTESGERRFTDLNALTDEYLKIAYHGLRAKDKNFTCELVTDFDGELGQVNVVPQEIGRVLLNLFNNALYAVNERAKQTSAPDYKPRVGVRTRRLADKVEVQVSDNGTGIPESVMKKIFQPFFTTKPTGEGTGLGLSLSYDIVTKGHGGTLTVESTEGKGTEFVLSLPTQHTTV